MPVPTRPPCFSACPPNREEKMGQIEGGKSRGAEMHHACERQEI